MSTVKSVAIIGAGASGKTSIPGDDANKLRKSF
jgi:uridine kinase